MIRQSVSAAGAATAGQPDDHALTAERRTHLKAYQIWSELNRSGALPDASEILAHPAFSFADHVVVIEIDPSCTGRIIALGSALAAPGMRLPLPLAEVPGRSLLSRLTDHVLEPIANRTPVGFEAEFVDEHGQEVSYRAIAMPCAEDGIHVDIVLGVISYKIRSEDPPAEASLAPSGEIEPLKGPVKSPKRTDPKGFGRKAGSDPAVPTIPTDPKPGEAIAEFTEEAEDSDERRELIMSYKEKLAECMEIEGALAVALVDLATGMTLAKDQGSAKGLDLDLAAAGNTNVVRAKLETMKSLKLDDHIEDILITLGKHFHLIRPLTSDSGKGLFIYLALDKNKANLAMARHKLRLIEEGVEV
jgi:hypothetical protein